MPKPPNRRQQLTLILMMIIIGVGVGFGVWFIRFFPSAEKADLPPTRVLTEPPAPIPTRASVRGDGSAFPTLFIPEIGVNTVIVESLLQPEGWQVDHLLDRVGHLEATSWVGQGGNVVLAGHVENADGSPSVFAELDDLQPDSILILTDQMIEYHYRVEEIREVNPDDLSVIYSTDTEKLTLITCSDYNFLSSDYEKRLVVIATRVN